MTHFIPEFIKAFQEWEAYREIIDEAYIKRLNTFGSRDGMPLSSCVACDAGFDRIDGDQAIFKDYDGDEMSLSLFRLLNATDDEWRQYVVGENVKEEVRRARLRQEAQVTRTESEVRELRRLAEKYPDAL